MRVGLTTEPRFLTESGVLVRLSDLPIRTTQVDKRSPSDLYAVAAAISLLFLAILNNPWVMLAVSVVGFIAGLVIARLPAPEGQDGRPGSLRRAGMFGLVGFAVAAVLASIILIR